MHDGELRNLGNLIGRNTDLNKTAFIDVSDWNAPKYYSFRDIETFSANVAAALLAASFAPGTNIALVGRNSVTYFATYLGIMRARMIAVPINHKLPISTVEFILQDSSIELITADADMVLPGIRIKRVDLDSDTAVNIAGTAKLPPFSAQETAFRSPAMVLYTSGSTGRPKGVVLSHESQCFALTRWDNGREELSKHMLQIAAPLYHMNALFLSKLSLYMGATTVLHPSFSARTYIEAIPRFGVTWLTGIPTIFSLMLGETELLQRTDRSGVIRIGMGSSPVTDALVNAIRGYFPGARIGNIYGTTEHGPSAFGPHPDGIPTPPTSIGYPCPGVEVRLVEMEGGSGAVLEVRSPANMNEYRNLPDRTAERLKDGWYHTGDVIRRDENGFYFFVGRDDDMFVCNGENIYPGEVELLLERHPAIRQACVVPVDDPIRGKAPVAFVVADAPITEADIQAFARESGPAVQYPRRVVFLKELPLSGTNKVDRNALKQYAADLPIGEKPAGAIAARIPRRSNP